MAKSKPTAAANTLPAAEAETEVVNLAQHRVLMSDTHDPLNPIVTALVIVAESYEAAVAFTSKNGFDPFKSDLPKGSYRCSLRLEEVLPFAREGFGIRRSTWGLTEIALMHPGINTRMDLYIRNPEQPSFAPQHKHELDKLGGPDLLSEDWSVCPRPPTFGNRRAHQSR